MAARQLRHLEDNKQEYASAEKVNVANEVLHKEWIVWGETWSPTLIWATDCSAMSQDPTEHALGPYILFIISQEFISLDNRRFSYPRPLTDPLEEIICFTHCTQPRGQSVWHRLQPTYNCDLYAGYQLEWVKGSSSISNLMIARSPGLNKRRYTAECVG